MIILLMQMISITLNLIGIETLSGDVLPQTGESFVGVDLDTAEQNCNLVTRKQSGQSKNVSNLDRAILEGKVNCRKLQTHCSQN